MAAAFPAIIALATTAYTTHQQEVMATEARKNQETDRDKQTQLLKDKTKQDEVQAEAERLRARRKALGSFGGGRQSTILTSPLGVMPTAAAPQKTVLGG